MKARRSRSALASAFTCFVLALSATTAASGAGSTPLANGAANAGCTPLFASDLHGRAGARALQSRALPNVERLGLTANRVAQLLSTDSTFWVDRCGHPYYRDVPLPTVSAHLRAAGPQKPTAAPYPLSQTFLLDSRPGSQRTIYLNFTGRTMTGTAWNAQSFWSMPSGYHVAAFDTDGNTSSFSAGEQAIIQSVWQRVSEDYATFDVNVTTRPPAAGVIDRSGPSDQIYGTEAVITSDSALAADCMCGGIAWLNAFAYSSQHAAYQPAFVFQASLDGINTKAKYLAEAAAHEVGHNFGLTHDGTSADEYYTPRATEWAPVMGASYYVPLTQWSKGEYPDANNHQDDLAVISAGGAPALADTVGNTLQTATQLPASLTASGLVNTSSDSDWYSFTGHGAVTISAKPSATAPDLDVDLRLYNSSGSLVAQSNPATAVVDFETASGLDATISTTLASGTYYIAVQGSGFGTPGSATYYSNYASIGPFSLAVAMLQPAITATTLGAAYLGQNYSHTLAAAGGTAPYAWSVTAGALPDGLALNSSTGELTGVPGAIGNSTFTVQVTDAANNSDSLSLSLSVSDVPIAPSEPQTVSATGGVRHIDVTWTAPLNTGGRPIDGYTAAANPGGFTCTTTGGTQCTIAGLTNATAYSVVVTAHNSIGDGTGATAVNATTANVPTAPTSVVAVPHDRTLTASWLASDARGSAVTNYLATAQPGGSFCNATNASGCVITGLTNGQTYTVTVIATNEAGDSAPSAASSPTRPYTRPTSPTAVSATSLPGALRVSWRASNNGGYPIRRYTATASPGRLACTSSAAPACIIRGLLNGVAYRVVVTASTQAGTSGPSLSSNSAIPYLSPKISVVVKPGLRVARNTVITLTTNIKSASSVKSLKPFVQQLRAGKWLTVASRIVSTQKLTATSWQLRLKIAQSGSLRIYVPATKTSKVAISRTVRVTTK